MESNNSNCLKTTTKIEDDVIFHLNQILIDFQRIKLDYNKDVGIGHKMDNLINKVKLITELYKRIDSKNYRNLKNYLNNEISINPNLKGFIVYIENSRCNNKKGEIKKVKIEI
ncbi:MAG: hypothetical protein J0L86_15010 [Flavobacteriales bacterium]|nr:hypothetical protein [Flavobacteriales bacterium]